MVVVTEVDRDHLLAIIHLEETRMSDHPRGPVDTLGRLSTAQVDQDHLCLRREVENYRPLKIADHIHLRVGKRDLLPRHERDLRDVDIRLREIRDSRGATTIIDQRQESVLALWYAAQSMCRVSRLPFLLTVLHLRFTLIEW